MKFTIQSIFRNTTDKEGKRYLDRNGKQFIRLSITTNDGKRVSANIFKQDDPRLKWEKGQEVEWELVEKEWNGKKYWEMQTPKSNTGSQIVAELLQEILANQKIIIKKLDALKPKDELNKLQIDVPYEDDDVENNPL